MLKLIRRMIRTIIQSIKSEEDLQRALTRIDELIDVVPGTLAFDELDILSDLVFAYEEKHHPIDAPDPILLINSKLETGDISSEALKEVLPNKSVRSQILNRKRRIPANTMYEMVRRKWVPAESLFKPTYFERFTGETAP